MKLCWIQTDKVTCILGTTNDSRKGSNTKDVASSTTCEETSTKGATNRGV